MSLPQHPRDMGFWPTTVLAARALLRLLLTVAGVLLAYYWVPTGDGKNVPAGILVLIVGLSLFAVVLALQIRRIGRADRPVLRAIEVLTSVLFLFLCIFALSYYVIAFNSPSAFSEALDRTDSLYFTITTFATVGFGDITAVSTTARVIVMIQMLLDLVFLAALVRIITSVTKNTLQNRGLSLPTAPAENVTAKED